MFRARAQFNPALLRKRTVEYPSSDGKPMAETDLHFLETTALVMLLKDIFRGRNDVYVAADNFIYYTQGEPKHRFSPDAYVVFGVKNTLRRVYKLWEEKHVPAAVFEISSRKTRNEDLVTKKRLCRKLGVMEYFLYDPEAEYLHPALQGFRLVEGRYRPMKLTAEGRLQSAELKLEFGLRDGLLAVFDSATGKRILRVTEQRDYAKAQAAQAQAEAARAHSENARLREELARLKRK